MQERGVLPNLHTWQTPATAPPTFGDEVPVGADPSFWVEYDKLVIAVGAYSQSKMAILSKTGVTSHLRPAFDIPGVKEHAHFLKTIADARISGCV